jgi:hypothetical protein
MFLDIWLYALNQYKTERLIKKNIEISRANFKLNNYKMRKKFNYQYKHISQKEYSLYKYVIQKNCRNILNQEYRFAYKNFYNYYLMHNNNFFYINKVGERIYIINLNWNCYNCIKNKEDNFKFNIKFKFYQKHDYPVPFYHKIVKIILDHNIYINTFVKQYLFCNLLKIWIKQ